MSSSLALRLREGSSLSWSEMELEKTPDWGLEEGELSSAPGGLGLLSEEEGEGLGRGKVLML